LGDVTLVVTLSVTASKFPPFSLGSHTEECQSLGKPKDCAFQLKEPAKALISASQDELWLLGCDRSATFRLLSRRKKKSASFEALFSFVSNGFCDPGWSRYCSGFLLAT